MLASELLNELQSAKDRYGDFEIDVELWSQDRNEDYIVEDAEIMISHDVVHDKLLFSIQTD